MGDAPGANAHTQAGTELTCNRDFEGEANFLGLVVADQNVGLGRAGISAEQFFAAMEQFLV